MHPHIARRLREAQPAPADQAAAREAWLATFDDLGPAELELTLLEHQDGRWTDADRRRRDELLKRLGG